MIIWGNHSSTQYPDFYNATIKGKPAQEIIHDQEWLKTSFISTVQQRGAEIIKARGASSAASAANAVIDGVSKIIHNSPEGQYYSMCVASQGEYDVDAGLIFSFPCQTKNKQWSVATGWKHNDFGKEKFMATLNELRAERDTVRQLGLIK